MFIRALAHCDAFYNCSIFDMDIPFSITSLLASALLSSSPVHRTFFMIHRGTNFINGYVDRHIREENTFSYLFGLSPGKFLVALECSIIGISILSSFLSPLKIPVFVTTAVAFHVFVFSTILLMQVAGVAFKAMSYLTDPRMRKIHCIFVDRKVEEWTGKSKKEFGEVCSIPSRLNFDSANSKQSEEGWNGIPADIKLEILEFLENEDLEQLRLVCKTWHSIVRKDLSVPARFLKRNYGSLFSQFEEIVGKQTFRKVLANKPLQLSRLIPAGVHEKIDPSYPENIKLFGTEYAELTPETLDAPFHVGEDKMLGLFLIFRFMTTQIDASGKEHLAHHWAVLYEGNHELRIAPVMTYIKRKGFFKDGFEACNASNSPIRNHLYEEFFTIFFNVLFSKRFTPITLPYLKKLFKGESQGFLMKSSDSSAEIAKSESSQTGLVQLFGQ